MHDGSKRRSVLALVAGGALALSGCGGGGGSSHTAPSAAALPQGVSVAAAAFPDVSNGVVLIQERSGQSGSPTADTLRTLVAITRDGGTSWSVKPSPLPAPSGITMDFPTPSTGWLAGAYVTHDHGDHWTHVAAGTHADLGVTSVSIAGGTVWATAEKPDGKVIVLTGPAAGQSLTQTTAAPGVGGTVVATSATVAYVADTTQAQVRSTADGGHHWRRLAPACPSGHAQPLQSLTARGRELLEICGPTGKYTGDLIARSTDAGRTWTTTADPDLVNAPHLVSSQVAWSTCGVDATAVCRSTDGGATWSPVASKTKIPDLEVLTASGPLVAHALSSEVLAGTNTIVVSTTTDGGATWTTSQISLDGV